MRTKNRGPAHKAMRIWNGARDRAWSPALHYQLAPFRKDSQLTLPRRMGTIQRASLFGEMGQMRIVYRRKFRLMTRWSIRSAYSLCIILISIYSRATLFLQSSFQFPPIHPARRAIVNAAVAIPVWAVAMNLAGTENMVAMISGHLILRTILR
jgi:hypothetical protein